MAYFVSTNFILKKQTRDANGFKQHTLSESHVRQMLVVGENSKKYISDYSNQFQRDFLQLLKTSRSSEKFTSLNHFYQEYISNKEHIHMNATRWQSLTEFAKYLGREGICRVEEDEKGINIAWIDSSPEALRRQNALRKKELQDRGDEEREQAIIKAQIRRAQLDAEGRDGDEGFDEAERELKREEGEKFKLNFGAKPAPAEGDADSSSAPGGAVPGASKEMKETTNASTEQAGTTDLHDAETNSAGKTSVKMNFQSKPKNVFAAAKKNVLGGKKAAIIEQPKKMSEAERIMKEELEKKRIRSSNAFGGPPAKKQRF